MFYLLDLQWCWSTCPGNQLCNCSLGNEWSSFIFIYFITIDIAMCDRNIRFINHRLPFADYPLPCASGSVCKAIMSMAWCCGERCCRFYSIIIDLMGKEDWLTWAICISSSHQSSIFSLILHQFYWGGLKKWIKYCPFLKLIVLEMWLLNLGKCGYKVSMRSTWSTIEHHSEQQKES